MPVAKLSRNFYEKFGDELTDELVNCLNTIESSYRLELRDLFDAHFGRFEARLEHRIADLRGELRAEIHKEIGSVRAEIGAFRAELIKWMFAFWVPVALAVIGLYFKP
ncbi:MAG: hypothetical protein EXR93_00040 [Gemmatimonadetes bacterium]|nr:hypothetical protein [Gemmatimonadota bacterium]